MSAHAASFVYTLSIVSFLLCFLTWIHGHETTAGNSSLATDSKNRSDSSSDNTISAQYSLLGTIIAAALAAGVGIYSAISNNKQSNQNRDLQLKLTKLNTEQNEKNNRFQIDLASINAKLASQKAEEDAHRDYKYDALKRLYLECEPILFQLDELSDYVLWRITGLAEDAREGRLKPNKGHLSDIEKYTFKSTIYRLIVPMAAFRLLQS